jgi:arylsulfatase A-like enzyme
VKKGVTLDTPARLVDIAPTVVTLLGIEPQKMDGVVLADGLEQATPLQVKAQAEVTQFLEPLRAALKDSSQADLAENEKQFGIKER